jgi:TRAP-type C4-dicarboxylate transport system substrate-binding protein
MWDGYWFLSNGKIWSSLPQDVQQIIDKHVNAGAVRVREDLFTLNQSTEKVLADKGMQIVTPDTAAFRAKLQSAGFYKEWRQKYGEDAWRLLEKSTGSIS